MKYKNLEILKKKSIPIYNLYKQSKLKEYKHFGFEMTSDILDIYYKDIDKVYLTSVIDKTYESELLVNEVLSGSYDEIVVIGFGNNTFMSKLLNRIDNNIKLHVVEFEEVIDIMFSNVSIKKMDLSKINNLAVIDMNFDIKHLLNRIFLKTNMNFKIFVLPQYERLFKEKIDEVFSEIKKIISLKKISMQTNSGYQKLWIYNSIINFKHVLETPNFLDLKKCDFSKSMALLVGAGPSLSFELENLKKISEEKNCYIFAIGSAYKALHNNGIKIDAVFSYDPTDLNSDVLSDYYDQQINCPICFGSSIGFKSIRKVDYTKAFHMLTSQDYFGQYLLQGTQNDIINDAPTVAVIALQALVKIGFGNIAFVGQNMAYLDGKNYADGIVYDRLKGKSYKSDLMILDVFGNEVSTAKGYVSTRDLIQQIISITPKINYVNTTNGGAAIEGADYRSFEEIDFNNFVKDVDLIKECPKNNYVMQEIKERFYDIVEDRKEFLRLLNDGLLYIYKVKEMLDFNQIKNVDTLVALENIYNQICKTKYFSILISKLDRNYLNIFESSIVEINREKDLRKKYESVFNKMGTLFSLFNKEDKAVFDLFKYITRYINWEEDLDEKSSC